MELQRAKKGQGQVGAGALLPLVWLGAGGSYAQLTAAGPGGLSPSAITAARRGFQALLPAALAVGGGGLDAGAEAALAAAALLEVLAPRAEDGASAGLLAASNIFQAVRDATEPAVRRASVHHEALAVNPPPLLLSKQ